MKRIFPSLLGFAAGFSLIVFLLLSSVDMSCFRLSFFDEQYRELNTAENLDMSHEDLMNATQTLWTICVEAEIILMWKLPLRESVSLPSMRVKVPIW